MGNRGIYIIKENEVTTPYYTQYGAVEHVGDMIAAYPALDKQYLVPISEERFEQLQNQFDNHAEYPDLEMRITIDRDAQTMKIERNRDYYYSKNGKHITEEKAIQVVHRAVYIIKENEVSTPYYSHHGGLEEIGELIAIYPELENDYLSYSSDKLLELVQTEFENYPILSEIEMRITIDRDAQTMKIERNPYYYPKKSRITMLTAYIRQFFALKIACQLAKIR